MFQKPFLIDVFYERRVEDHHLNRNKTIYETYTTAYFNNQSIEFNLHSFNDKDTHLILICFD